MAVSSTQLCVLLLVTAVAAVAANGIKINGDLEVTGNLGANTARLNGLTVKGDMNVQASLNTKKFKSTKAVVDTVYASLIKSPTGTITLEGHVVIAHDQKKSAEAMSLIVEDVVVGGVQQWKLVRHEDFQNGAEGWSVAKTSSCGGKDFFLGGHCNAGHGEIFKTFNSLPAHTQIRVSARYHFLDDWRGETAFAKLDKNFLWTHTTPASPSAGGINMCGNPAFPEHRFSTPIDVVLSHAEKDVTIAFGLEGHNEAQAKRSACDRSFGVDDVMVYVR